MAKKVFIMLSGGVDSSVAAFLLKKQGYGVTGVYFKRYKADGDVELCRSDGLSAKRVAETLGIDFKVYDLEQDYKEKVFDYLIDSYSKGLTPNPDIVCNREIKFGVFAKRAFKEGADFIASGHYSAISNCVFGVCLGSSKAYFGKNTLKEAKDKNKDQSYFLSQINPSVLDRLIFPLWKLKKNQIRKIAKRVELHTANRKESQGICFVGKKMNLKKFLQNYIPTQEGFAYLTDGRKVATHKGVQFYTTGERRGFNLLKEAQSPNSKALYVIRKNIEDNSLILGSKDELEAFSASVYELELENIQRFLPFKEEKDYLLRIRHRGSKSKCRIKQKGKNIKIELREPVFAPSEGQFATIYDGELVVLSGEIKFVKSKML